MRIEPLNFTHQKLLEEQFKKMGMEISEYTFANLYLFRQIHHYQVIFNKDIYIKGIARDKSTYLMPASPIEQIHMDDLLQSAQGCDFLFPIPEKWSDHFVNLQFDVSFLEEESDYLYLVDKMSTFPGRKLSGRRNLLKQFNELFPAHRSVPLTSQNAEDALLALEEWRKETNDEEGVTDYAECREALLYMEKLALNGQMTYVNEQPVAFVLGEELNAKIYVIHFAKAIVHFKGIYQYIYHTFANELAKNYEMINLEQDLGAMELRQAKRAYMPDRLVRKLRIKLWKTKA